jgi:hypothetical protein
MKSYTDLEQSKKLAEILPTESADMFYRDNGIDVKLMWEHIAPKVETPCWSLAALLDILPNGTNIVKEEADTENKRYMCTVGTKKGIISTFGNNPIDACYEMILKLN